MSSAARDARQRWDVACDVAQAALREARTAAQSSGQEWLASWASTEIGQLVSLQAGVDGKLRRPGRGAPGLLHDFPVDATLPPYRPAFDALSEVLRLWQHGLDLDGWDWSRGFPRGWPVSVRDRVKAVVPWHDA